MQFTADLTPGEREAGNKMQDQIVFIFALLLAFQVKHFFGDYLLQTTWMVNGKSRAGPEFVFPLSVHVLVHAALTLAIVMVINPSLWYLSVFDFAVHFTMDRIKAGPRFLGRYNDPNKSSFWIPFGIDQMVHHLTHYIIILILFIERFNG